MVLSSLGKKKKVLISSNYRKQSIVWEGHQNLTLFEFCMVCSFLNYNVSFFRYGGQLHSLLCLLISILYIRMSVALHKKRWFRLRTFSSVFSLVLFTADSHLQLFVWYPSHFPIQQCMTCSPPKICRSNTVVGVWKTLVDKTRDLPKKVLQSK